MLFLPRDYDSLRDHFVSSLIISVNRAFIDAKILHFEVFSDKIIRQFLTPCVREFQYAAIAWL